jgi:taurine dioxygenase
MSTSVSPSRTGPPWSILRAVTLPEFGGDTSWADSQAAYASLSEPVRELADQLVAVHDGTVVTDLPPVEHPVVRVHPETGRKGLFVNPGFTTHIAGVSDAESRGILDLLYAHLTKPEHTIRHRWSPGDVGFWDNRSTAHYANRDYTDQRVMRRITLAGDRPTGPASV